MDDETVTQDRTTVIASAPDRPGTARQLLRAAEALGVDLREVRTVEGGSAFDVPTRVAERAKTESDEPYPTPEPETRRTASTTPGEWADGGEPAEPAAPAGSQGDGGTEGVETTTQVFGAGDVAGAETVLGATGGEPAQA